MDKAIYQSLDDYASRRKSRREFIRTVSALGVTPLAAESLLGYMQQDRAAVTESLPADEGIRIVERTGGGLLVEQLRTAGVRYIFHTNTSGVAAVMDHLVDASDMHVVMVTHEGQAVAAAQGYALATGELAFFLGSDDGIDNAASNLHCAFADTTPLIAAFENGDLAPLEPYSAWSWRCTDAETMQRCCAGGSSLRSPHREPR